MLDLNEFLLVAAAADDDDVCSFSSVLRFSGVEEERGIMHMSLTLTSLFL